MKYMIYGLLAMAAFSIKLVVEACPFTFSNDGTANVLIFDTKDGKKYYAAAGTSVNIPGSIAEPTLWIYTEAAPRSEIYKPVYGIVEEECMPEDAPAVVLKWSKLNNLARTLDRFEGFRIRHYNPTEYPEIVRQINHGSSFLSRLFCVPCC